MVSGEKTEFLTKSVCIKRTPLGVTHIVKKKVNDS